MFQFNKEKNSSTDVTDVKIRMTERRVTKFKNKMTIDDFEQIE